MRTAPVINLPGVRLLQRSALKWGLFAPKIAFWRSVIFFIEILFFCASARYVASLNELRWLGTQCSENQSLGHFSR